MLLQVLVLVLGGGQQAGDVADAFGDALSEQQFGAEPQVLRVFDEAEQDDSSLAGAKLFLQQGQRTWSHRVGSDGADMIWQLHRTQGVIKQGEVTRIYVITRDEELDTDLPMETLHRGRLPDVAYMHGDLKTSAKGLGMEE